MWFKKKRKNRRSGRPRNVLDVKLRSSKVRAARARMAAVALGVVFGTIFGLYVLWRSGEWALNTFVYKNKSFAVRKVLIETDGVISPAQIQRWCDVRAGENLLALDLGRVKRDLELVPLIQSVSVERILPGTLHIRVSERTPIAQVNVPRPRPGGGFDMLVYQLDADGYVILPLDPRLRAGPLRRADGSLPQISGINLTELQPGRQIQSTQGLAALKWIGAFESSPMAGLVELKDVDVSAPEVLVVTTGQGSQVTFGLDDFNEQLLRWQAIYELGERMQKVIATLDLAVDKNIPATWLEASAVPPPAHRIAKPAGHRRKNV